VLLAFGLLAALPGFSQTKVKDLGRAGFRNVLIINGHGGNTEPTRKAMTRLHQETGAHFMVVDWWTVDFEAVKEVYGAKAQQPGHGDMEEAALVMAYDSGLVDREIYEKLGKDEVGKTRTEAGVVLMPAWSTSMYPEKGAGYLDFDIAKAKAYAAKRPITSRPPFSRPSGAGK